jgi:hypothetical protein
VKQVELIKRINKIAKTKQQTAVFTEGASHTHIKLGDKQTTLPRHSEINEFTARGILKYLEEK